MKANMIYILTNENFNKEVLCSKRPVVIEFSTDWCGTSHIIAPILNEMVIKFREDIKFCKIDIEEYEELAKQYGVRKIPTILFIKNGEIVDFIVGAVSRKILVKKITLLTL